MGLVNTGNDHKRWLKFDIGDSEHKFSCILIVQIEDLEFQ